MEDKNTELNIFWSAFVQVFLVCLNTFFISKDIILGIAICSFSISWFWAGNVKKIAVSNKFQKYIYSLGAMLGGVTGYYFGKILLYLW